MNTNEKPVLGKAQVTAKKDTNRRSREKANTAWASQVSWATVTKNPALVRFQNKDGIIDPVQNHANLVGVTMGGLFLKISFPTFLPCGTPILFF